MIRLLAAASLLFLFDVGLGWALDAWGFGGQLLSMGPHTPPWLLAAGALFAGARLVLVVLAPGLACAVVMGRLLTRLIRTRARS
jgi:hypothetical protein